MEIPFKKLSEETLQGIIKDFVLREGTEYGLRDFSLEEKVQQVRRQLECGKAKIVFDAASGTANITVAE